MKILDPPLYIIITRITSNFFIRALFSSATKQIFNKLNENLKKSPTRSSDSPIDLDSSVNNLESSEEDEAEYEKTNSYENWFNLKYRLYSSYRIAEESKSDYSDATTLTSQQQIDEKRGSATTLSRCSAHVTGTESSNLKCAKFEIGSNDHLPDFCCKESNFVFNWILATPYLHLNQVNFRLFSSPPHLSNSILKSLFNVA